MPSRSTKVTAKHTLYFRDGQSVSQSDSEVQGKGVWDSRSFDWPPPLIPLKFSTPQTPYGQCHMAIPFASNFIISLHPHRPQLKYAATMIFNWAFQVHLQYLGLSLFMLFR